MASSGKNTTSKRSVTVPPVQIAKRSRMLAPSTLSALPLPAAAISVPMAGKGFNFLPPLPIISMPFKFLKSVDLKTIGKSLGDVPSGFGWKLVEWKPTVVYSGS